MYEKYHKSRMLLKNYQPTERQCNGWHASKFRHYTYKNTKIYIHTFIYSITLCSKSRFLEQHNYYLYIYLFIFFFSFLVQKHNTGVEMIWQPCLQMQLKVLPLVSKVNCEYLHAKMKLIRKNEKLECKLSL